MTVPAPTTKPRLRRDGPDAYVAALDRFTFDTDRPTVRFERDGVEWVQTFDTYQPSHRWYPTVTAVRRHVADVNVRRWYHAGCRTDADPDLRAAVRAFSRWAKGHVGGPECEGRNLGWAIQHGGCCDSIVRRPLPDGVTVLDLYERWRDETGQEGQP